ncbi:hypothetical protein HKD37_14G040628 [Glycine soja]
MGDSDKCGLYVYDNPPQLVVLGRFYKGSTTIHNVPLSNNQLKVDVEEVRDANACNFVPTKEVSWDATMFGVHNDNFPLYIKQEHLSEIAHDGQCLSISVIQLWILHMTETSMRAGNIDVYGFLEPYSIQKFGQSQFESEDYIKKWMQNSLRDVYLGAYLNGALKGFNNSHGSKSKGVARWILVK